MSEIILRRMVPRFQCERGDAILNDKGEPVKCARHDLPLEEREMGNETVRICRYNDTLYKVDDQY